MYEFKSILRIFSKKHPKTKEDVIVVDVEWCDGDRTVEPLCNFEFAYYRIGLFYSEHMGDIDVAILSRISSWLSKMKKRYPQRINKSRTRSDSSICSETHGGTDCAPVSISYCCPRISIEKCCNWVSFYNASINNTHLYTLLRKNGYSVTKFRFNPKYGKETHMKTVLDLKHHNGDFFVVTPCHMFAVCTIKELGSTYIVDSIIGNTSAKDVCPFTEANLKRIYDMCGRPSKIYRIASNK